LHPAIPELAVIPRFYFQQYVNGRLLARDQRGREFGSVDEACTYALCRAPGILRKNLRSSAKDTFVSTAISDGKRTLYIIRGKITSEKQ
jgi:hypothetical protein